MAAQLKRVKAAYGNAAIFVPYGTGSYSQINGRQTAQRLMNLFGGSLGYYNNYSWACMAAATPTVYGTNVTGNQRQDWVNARYILMWGWNPSEMRDGTNTRVLPAPGAREKGARIVCIDPRMTLSAVALADEWIPIRPGTDVAMMSAMAHVIITEGLHDTDFVANALPRLRRSPDAGRRWRARKATRTTSSGRATGRPRRPPGPSASPASRARRSPGWRANTPRPSRPCSTRATACSGGLTASRPSGPDASWPRSRATSASRAAGPAGMGLQAPDGGPLWNVFPAGAEPGQGPDPGVPLDRGRRPRHEMTAARRPERRRASSTSNIKLIYVGRLQHPRQPARQHQPDRSASSATRRSSSSSPCRTTS